MATSGGPRLARKLTEVSNKDALAWTVRGHSALEVGDAKDALDSFNRALEIDEKAEVPPYIRARKKE